MPISNDPTKYDQPWRRNYERYAATMWFAGAAAYAAGGLFSSLPAAPFYCTAALCAGMGLLRMPEALRLAALQKNVGGRPLSVVSIQALQALSEEKAHADALWLGKGFVWTPEHAQRLYELLALDWSSIARESRETSARELFRKAGDVLDDTKRVVMHDQQTDGKTIEEMGQKWIHGVESKEFDIWQPLSHAAGHTLIVGTTGAGKAQPYSARVLGPKGWLRMGDLRPGSVVLSWRGDPVEVDRIYERGVREMWAISTKDGRRAFACEEHLWTAWVTAPALPSSRKSLLMPSLNPSPSDSSSAPRSDAASSPHYLAMTSLLDPDGRLGLAEHLRRCGVPDLLTDAQGGRAQLVTTKMIDLFLRFGWKVELPAYSPQFSLRSKRQARGGGAADALRRSLQRSPSPAPAFSSFPSLPSFSGDSLPVERLEVKSAVPAGRMERMRCIRLRDARLSDELYVTDGFIATHNTRCFDILISQAILRGEAVIIVDPKGDAEMRENAKAACEACGRADDFVTFNPAYPDESVRINPLANYNEVMDIPSRIAALVGSDGGSGDAFRDFGWLAMNQICQALYYLDRPMTLKSIRRNLEMGGEDLFLDLMDVYGPKVLGEDGYAAALAASAEKLDRFATPVKCAVDVYKSQIVHEAPCNAVDGMVSLIEHDKAHFGKMITSLIPILSKLTSGSVGTLLSPDDPGAEDPRPMRNMKYFVETQKVVYIGLNSLADGIVGSALGSILLADMTSVSGGRYNYAEERSPVSVFVDEAAEVVNEPLIQLLNKGRGAGFRLYIATQLFADFAARLGSADKANQVLGNLNNIIALRTIEPRTQEFITSRMPKTRIARIERSQSQSIGAGRPAVHGANIGERLVHEEVPLFPPELLGALPGLEFIGVISGGHVVKSRIPFLARSEEAAAAMARQLGK